MGAIHLPSRKPICGKGINDSTVSMSDPSIHDAYYAWFNMINRCYGSTRRRAYDGCCVCDEWLLFSNFKKWFDENRRAGCQIDKDIINGKSRTYSPENCCFVPARINLVVVGKNLKHDLPCGVTFSKRLGYYYVRLTNGRDVFYLGKYYDKMEAFQAYKTEKEKYIKEVALDAFNKGEIDERTFIALQKFEVNAQ